MKRQLILEDGTIFKGEGFGSHTDKMGEVIFNTGMTGYQEILSDPSNCGQIVTLTYPLIGNYGINRDDFESINPAISGLIVNEVCNHPSNFRSQLSLDEYLTSNNIPGLSGIDTRKLTRLIRDKGTLKGVICGMDVNVDEVVNQLKDTNLPTNQVEQVSTKSAYPSPGRGHRIVLIDYGMKHSILHELNKLNCDVIVVPFNITVEEVLRLSPDGILLSNGPGNPNDLPEAIEMIKGILGKVPIFGVGLGHQLFALANDADIEKMKFGHRGSNHPVKDIKTGKIMITSQNHGFTVNQETLEKTKLEVTHIALNDDTVEGIRHAELPAFSVQFYPEASFAPEDENSLFNDFLQLIENSKKEGEELCQNA